MSKRILVLSGSPKESSFSEKLAESYASSASQEHDVRILKISEMSFDPNLTLGYEKTQNLEPDLLEFQHAIQWAEHLLITTPVWWGTLPAKFKGVFDRAFLPDFAFRYHAGKSMPEKLLKGKTARIIMTMDTPVWYYRLFQGAPALKQLKITTLGFCGYKNIRNEMLGPVISASGSKRAKWLDKLEYLGRQGA